MGNRISRIGLLIRFTASKESQKVYAYAIHATLHYASTRSIYFLEQTQITLPTENQKDDAGRMANREWDAAMQNSRIDKFT